MMHKEYFEAVRSLKQFNERYPKLLGKKAQVPKFLLCGLQSVGKTSLLEAMAEMPLGFTAEGTATRCPVEYELVRDSQEYAEVNGQRVQVDQIRKTVHKHMKVIKEEGEITLSSTSPDGTVTSSNFSNNILRVKIVTPKARNMVLLDTPGLKPNSNDSREKKELENMLLRLVGHDEYNLIVVYWYSGQAETNTDLQYIDMVLGRRRPDWKDLPGTVEVCNGLNNKDFSSSEFFLNELRLLGERVGNNYFVVLRYGEFLQAEKASKRRTDPVPIPFNKEIRYIQNIAKSEKEWLDTRFSGEDLAIPDSFMSKFGIERLINHLISVWMEFLLNHTKDIQLGLGKVMEELRREEKSLRIEITEAEHAAQNIEAAVTSYFEAFFSIFHDFVQEGTVRYRGEEGDSRVKIQLDLRNGSDLNKAAGRTLEEDLSRIKWSEWKAFRQASEKNKLTLSSRYETSYCPIIKWKNELSAIITMDFTSDSEVTVYQKNTKDLDASFMPVLTLNEHRNKLSLVGLLRSKPEAVVQDLVENEEYLFFVIYDDKKSKIRRYRHSKTAQTINPLDHDPKYFIEEYESDDDESIVSSSGPANRSSLSVNGGNGFGNGKSATHYASDDDYDASGIKLRPAQPNHFNSQEGKAELRFWKSLFGKLAWEHHNKSDFGKGSILRMISCFALILYNTPDFGDDPSKAHCTNQSGTIDVSKCIVHYLKKMVNDVKDGAPHLSKCILEIIRPYSSLIFEFLEPFTVSKNLERLKLLKPVQLYLQREAENYTQKQ